MVRCLVKAMLAQKWPIISRRRRRGALVGASPDDSHQHPLLRFVICTRSVSLIFRSYLPNQVGEVDSGRCLAQGSQHTTQQPNTTEMVTLGSPRMKASTLRPTDK